MMSFNYVFSELVQFLFPFFPEHFQAQKGKTRRKGIQICLDMSKEKTAVSLQEKDITLSRSPKTSLPQFHHYAREA